MSANRAAQLLTIAGFTGAALALTTWVFSSSHTTPFGRGGYRVNAVVPATALLNEGARVTMGGAEVGHVAKIERNVHGRPGTRLELHITDERVTPVPVDSRVQIRTRTQVGENYVAIAVGKATKAVESGAFLPATANEELVDVDQILSVLQGRTKERARKTIEGLGGALDGRGAELSDTLGAAEGLVEHGAAFVDVLDDDRRLVARLVDQLGRVTTEVGARGAAIDEIADQGLITLQALAARDGALSATLRGLPPTLDRVKHASATVGAVSGRVAPVLDNLTAAAQELRPAVNALTPAAAHGRAVVSNLGAASPRLQATLEQLTELSKTLPDAVPQLRKALCQVNPMLRYVEPYKDDVLGIAIGLSSASNSYDAVGHLIRLAPVINDTSASGLPAAVNTARSTLLNSGLFAKSKAVNYQPFMAPGLQGTTQATSNQPANAEALRKSGFTYPRVTADC